LKIDGKGKGIFYVVNVSNPASPHVDSYPTVPTSSSLYGCQYLNNTLYIMNTTNSRIISYNVSNPLIPIQGQSLALNSQPGQ